MARSIVHIVESTACRAGSLNWLLDGFFEFQRRKGWQVQVISDENLATAQEALSAADMVHVHGARGEAIRHCARLLRSSPRPYLLSPYAQLSPRRHQRVTWAQRWAYLSWQRGLLRRAWCLHVQAESEAAYLKRKRLAARTKLLPPGISIDAGLPSAVTRQATSPHPGRSVLFLGPVHPSEGLIPLLKSAAMLADRYPDFGLVLAGETDPLWHNVLQAAIRRQGFENRARIIPSPSPQDISQLLDDADVVVQPSPGPCCPVSALQAMARGKPVLVSPGCNLPDVQSAQAGWVVEPKRTSLQTALAEIAGSSLDDLQARGRRAADLVRQRHDWDRLGHEYQNLYARLPAATTARES